MRKWRENKKWGEFHFFPVSTYSSTLCPSTDPLYFRSKPKWLVWKWTHPCSPSAWTSARRWPVRAMPSTSPLPLVPPSPSPWTPGARTLPVRLPRRRQAPQPSGEIPRGERSTNLRSSEGLHLGLPVILLLLLKTCVTNVNMWQLLKRG